MFTLIYLKDDDDDDIDESDDDDEEEEEDESDEDDEIMSKPSSAKMTPKKVIRYFVVNKLYLFILKMIIYFDLAAISNSTAQANTEKTCHTGRRGILC
jgi:hypothetical protein